MHCWLGSKLSASSERLVQLFLSTAASGKSIIKLAGVPFRRERKRDGGMQDEGGREGEGVGTIRA